MRGIFVFEVSPHPTLRATLSLWRGTNFEFHPIKEKTTMTGSIEIGNRLRVVSAGTAPLTDGRIDILIDKGAFGSGEHETTASCLDILCNLPDLAGRRILDLGSGTGILAIAALKLGAGEAVCVDISPDAVKTCRHNGEINGVNDRIRHVTGTVESLSEETFDLVLANIYGDLLVDLAPQLIPWAEPGGKLLLSGMLWEYNFEVRQLYTRLGCKVLQNRMLEEFATVLLEKTP